MPNSNCLNLFAYGTLMDPDELAYDLVIPPEEVERRFRIKLAEATGWRRVFNKSVPDWGGAVLNLASDKESSVVGVLVMDMTHQELGMLDSSFPTHLPRKLIEVEVEGKAVPALAYLAKQPDADASISETYEKRMLELVNRMGDPVLSNFMEHTYQADGSPRYREVKPPPAVAPEDTAAPASPAEGDKTPGETGR